jgi:uncharacterized protein (TIGR02145 family)
MKKALNTAWMLLLVLLISGIHLGCPNDEENVQPNPDPSTFFFDTLTDIDGNVYLTVTIGTQTWMAENLRVTRLNDCTPIPLVTYDHWWPSDSPQRAHLKDDSTDVAWRGILYNWHVIHTGKLAPEGWRVPTAEDWQILIDFAGGKDVAGGKLKETGEAHWLTPNAGATNEFGFTAVPGYWRTASGHTLISSGELFFDKQTACYWTSTEENGFAAIYNVLRYNDATAATNTAAKSHALSVRLIKN